MPLRETKRPTAGITLLEMIVVVTIIALMVGLSFPSISAGLDSVRMSSATGAVASFLNTAVTHAQRRQQGVALVISPRDGVLEQYTNEPGYMKEYKLPDGIMIEAVLPDDGLPPGVPRHFMIMPGGTVPGIAIQLANRRDGHRLVKLDPMTGYPRVEAAAAR
ncbi:MAG TPA: prepilin-type N-terminal cleavage/methylation domain-containing protein [Candidatus Solibacter sp.]|nr:prepilin-type N-terminal cleavage/methylation domain-containing protein [Candidatus Solibacter sp.]